MTALRWALIAVSIATVAFWFVHSVGRRLLYPAPPLASNSDVVLGPRADRVWLDGPGMRTEAFLLASTSSTNHPGPLVIYAHGNGGGSTPGSISSNRAPPVFRSSWSRIPATAARRARRPSARSPVRWPRPTTGPRRGQAWIAATKSTSSVNTRAQR